MPKTKNPNAPVFYVYELIDPRDDEVFYIGKGSMAYGRTGRYRDHLWKARRDDPGVKNSRIRDILEAGSKPTLNIAVEGLTEKAAFAAEAARVEERGLLRLSNAIRGGHGGWTGVQSGGKHWSRRHPEKRLAGETHPWNKDPDLKRRNLEAMQAALAADPSLRPRGDAHGKCKLSDNTVRRIREIYSEAIEAGDTSVTCSSLAGSFGVTITHISRVLRGDRGGEPIQVRKGKLSPHQVDEIISLRLAGATFPELGRKFSVHPSRAHQIFKTYKAQVEVLPGIPVTGASF